MVNWEEFCNRVILNLLVVTSIMTLCWLNYKQPRCYISPSSYSCPPSNSTTIPDGPADPCDPKSGSTGLAIGAGACSVLFAIAFCAHRCLAEHKDECIRIWPGFIAAFFLVLTLIFAGASTGA